MALYTYHALSKAGKRLTGQLDAPTEQAVKEQLIKQGLYPIRIEAATTGAGRTWREIFLEDKIKPKDVIFFTKQLAILLRSGIPLVQALELLGEQFEGRMRRVIIALKDGIKEGGSLAQGMSNYPNVFENLYVQLVRAGEASGKLEIILDRLTNYLERRLETRQRVTAALRQPIIQLVLVALITVFLLTNVVPRISALFKKLKGDLPTPTVILISLSNAIRSYYLIIAIVLVGIFVAYKAWHKTPRGKMTIDALKLRLPIVGYFARTSAVVQFSSTLGMLLEGGVNLAESLDIVCSIVDNQVLANTLREAREKIVKEGKIAQFLKQTKIFPPMAMYLIKTGEESGQLDQMLIVVAKNYETELNEFTATLAEQLNPLMLFVMVGVVGFIIFAIAMPIMRLTQVSMQNM